MDFFGYHHFFRERVFGGILVDQPSKKVVGRVKSERHLAHCEKSRPNFGILTCFFFEILRWYTLEDEHGTWKSKIGLSSFNPSFLGSILIFQGCMLKWNKLPNHSVKKSTSPKKKGRSLFSIQFFVDKISTTPTFRPRGFFCLGQNKNFTIGPGFIGLPTQPFPNMKGWITSPQQNPVETYVRSAEVKHQKHHVLNVTVTGGCTSKGDRTARRCESWDPQRWGFPLGREVDGVDGVSSWRLGASQEVGREGRASGTPGLFLIGSRGVPWVGRRSRVLGELVSSHFSLI